MRAEKFVVENTGGLKFHYFRCIFENSQKALNIAIRWDASWQDAKKSVLNNPFSSKCQRGEHEGHACRVGQKLHASENYNSEEFIFEHF